MSSLRMGREEAAAAAQQRREVVNTVYRRPQAAEGRNRKICLSVLLKSYISLYPVPRWLNNDRAACKNAVRIKSKFASDLNISDVSTAC